MMSMKSWRAKLAAMVEQWHEKRHPLTNQRRQQNQKDQRVVAVFRSPGTIRAGRPVPTMPSAGAELNQVKFQSGPSALLYSDGSFRKPGRRRVLVSKGGRTFVLSGRQLRNLRKAARRNQKAAALQAAAAAGTTTSGGLGTTGAML